MSSIPGLTRLMEALSELVRLLFRRPTPTPLAALSNRPSSRKKRLKTTTTVSTTEDHSEDEDEVDLALEARKPGSLWNTVIFFPDEEPVGSPDSPTSQLVSLFEGAKLSIYVCMYLTSNPLMMNLVTKKVADGLTVYVISDWDTFTAHNNFGPKIWRKAGIEVRMKATGFLMHHKFVIIDGEAVLTGSLNWTKQGFRHNNENVLVTTNPNIVAQYMAEFNNLWRLFADSGF